jgi:SAM-dependent methyltransferase
MDRRIRTVDDVLRLLDGLFAPDADRWTDRGASWWDGFYADRTKPVPFFVAKPDENLVSYLDRGLVNGGRALDLGCGPGRNALHLAARGFEVDAVDLSPTAVEWARERARESGTEATVRFHCGDALAGRGVVGSGPAGSGVVGSGFAGSGLAGSEVAGPELAGPEPTGPELAGPYDLVYDSGCFHHLPPHRRISYLALLDRVLAPGGHFALTCFASGGMGSELPDADFYRRSRLEGGLAYTAESLRWIFSDLTEIELRRMREEPAESPWFGEGFLWTALFRRPQLSSEDRP